MVTRFWFVWATLHENAVFCELLLSMFFTHGRLHHWIKNHETEKLKNGCSSLKPLSVGFQAAHLSCWGWLCFLSWFQTCILYLFVSRAFLYVISFLGHIASPQEWPHSARRCIFWDVFLCFLSSCFVLFFMFIVISSFLLLSCSWFYVIFCCCCLLCCLLGCLLCWSLIVIVCIAPSILASVFGVVFFIIFLVDFVYFIFILAVAESQRIRCQNMFHPNLGTTCQKQLKPHLGHGMVCIKTRTLFGCAWKLVRQYPSCIWRSPWVQVLPWPKALSQKRVSSEFDASLQAEKMTEKTGLNSC